MSAKPHKFFQDDDDDEVEDISDDDGFGMHDLDPADDYDEVSDEEIAEAEDEEDLPTAILRKAVTPKQTAQDLEDVAEALSEDEEDAEYMQEPDEDYEEAEEIKPTADKPYADVEHAERINEPLKGKAVDVVINGKVYKSNWLKPGHKWRKDFPTKEEIAEKKKSGPKKHVSNMTDTDIKRRIRDLSIDGRSAKAQLAAFRRFMSGYGLEKMQVLMADMFERGDYENFMKTFVFMAQYSLPKVASVDYKKSIEDETITGKTSGGSPATHTITIKDMRSGTRYEVNS